MALEDDIAAMNRNRVQRGMCLTVDDLAMQVQSHQGYLTNIVNELVEQIDIIETGGGVKVVIGQATAAVTGSDFQIDNIVSLTDGFTAPSAPLDVVNILGFSCDDNTYVYAVLNPATDVWLGWTDTGGVGGVLLIGGLTTATVDALDTTFTIDNIISFTSGYTHATSPQTVVNTFGRDLANDQPVYAIYRPDNDTWETWVDTDLSGGGGGSYLAGYGLELDGGDTFRLDDNGYLGTDFELPGSLDDGTFTWDTVQGWTKRLPDWSDTELALIANEGDDNPRWVVPEDFDTSIQFLTHRDGSNSHKLAWYTPPARAYGYVILPLPASTPDIAGFAASITINAIKVMVFDGANYTPSGDAVPGVNPTAMPIASGIMVPGAMVNGAFEVAWSDYKYGITGWDPDVDQSIGHDDGTEMTWQDDGPCTE